MDQAINLIRHFIENVEKLNTQQIRLALQELESLLIRQQNDINKLQFILNNNQKDIQSLNEINVNRLETIENLKAKIKNLEDEKAKLENEIKEYKNRDNRLVEEIVNRVVPRFWADVSDKLNKKFTEISQQLLNDNRPVRAIEQRMDLLNTIFNDLKTKLFDKLDENSIRMKSRFDDLDKFSKNLWDKLDIISNEMTNIKLAIERNFRINCTIHENLIELRDSITNRLFDVLNNEIVNSRKYLDNSILNSSKRIFDAIERNQNVLVDTIRRFNCNYRHENRLNNYWINEHLKLSKYMIIGAVVLFLAFLIIYFWNEIYC